jgi:hypothetical protein
MDGIQGFKRFPSVVRHVGLNVEFGIKHIINSGFLATEFRSAGEADRPFRNRHCDLSTRLKILLNDLSYYNNHRSGEAVQRKANASAIWEGINGILQAWLAG